MKNSILLKTISILIFVTVFTISPVFTQGQPPPPPPQQHGGTDNIPGGGAPIGSELILLLTMGLGYGVRKTLNKRKELLD